jgi:hypothetical protein
LQLEERFGERQKDDFSANYDASTSNEDLNGYFGAPKPTG